MRTHEQIAEYMTMEPEFYRYVTTTQILFYGNNVVREMEFFFDNTTEQELVIKMEDIEQGDPNRRIFWDEVSPEEKKRILDHIVGLLNQKGFPTEVVESTLLSIKRGQRHNKVPHNPVQLENNKDVPLIRRLLLKARRK